VYKRQGINNAVDLSSFDGDITVKGQTGEIKSTGNAGIYTTTLAGNTLIDSNKDITGLTYGVLSTATTGRTTVSSNGHISGNVGVDSGSTTGNVSVFRNDGIEGKAGDGVYLHSVTGDVQVNFNKDVSGTVRGIVATTGDAGRVIVTTNGKITGATYGVVTVAATGTTSIDTNGHIKGNIGVDAASTTGEISVLDNDGIEGLVGDGVFVHSVTGNLEVNNNKAVSGKAVGVNAITAGAGTITVKDQLGITGVAEAVQSFAADGATLIDNNGFVHSTAFWGIEAGSLAGDITITNNAGIKGDAGDGVWAHAATGAVTVNNNQAVQGTLNGIVATTTTKAINVQGNGAITGTATNGIFATNFNGAINIGNTAKNGAILGGVNGIWATNTGSGANNIAVDKNVTGTSTTGIIAWSATGDQTIDILGASTVVSGGVLGMNVLTTTGLATVNNDGKVKQIGDDGLPGTTLAGDGFWSTGKVVFNNKATGELFGDILSAGTSFDLNNKAGATWYAGELNSFAAITDKITNDGTIKVRDGVATFTSFIGLETLQNNATGVIDMQYSSAVGENLYGIDQMIEAAGSTLKLDLDFAKAGVGDDHTSYGTGAADTIYVNKATPAASVIVDLNILNRTTQNSLIATSGSIALVNANGAAYGPFAGAGLTDPGLGGLASLIPSTRYVFAPGDDPNSGAVKFVLQEDANGGVHLRWAPNVSAATLGGYSGAGVLGDSDSAAAAMGGAGAAIGGGAGGGMGPGGGASGGGAAGQVADLAAANASGNAGQSGASGGAYCGDGGRYNGFASADGSTSKFKGGIKGWSTNGSVGVERDVSPDACGQAAFGAFLTLGSSSSKAASGSSDLMTKGVGAYARVGSSEGFYASALGALNWGDAEMTNTIFGSTAEQESLGYMGNLTVGYAAKVSDTTTLDARVYASAGHVDGDGFTDTAGIVVNGSEADMTTVGMMLGLETAISDDVSGFVRGGVRHVNLSQSMTAFGIKVSGKTDSNFAGIEAGLNYKLNNSGVLTLSGNGDFSKTSTTWGGKIGATFKF
jgi:hypothetical protein